MKLKIAIFGPLCSGKSTLAKYIMYYIESKYFDKIEKVSFGSMIYEIAYKLFDMKEKNRKLLQDIGWKMRDIDEDVFTNYTIKYCNNISSNIIIEDARTFSEFNAMVENDFIMIYLDISKEKQLERIMKTYPNNYNEHINNLNHVSKQDLINLPKNKFNLIINVDNDENHINKIIENFIDNIYK